jgi:hypothetical protein
MEPNDELSLASERDKAWAAYVRETNAARANCGNRGFDKKDPEWLPQKVGFYAGWAASAEPKELDPEPWVNGYGARWSYPSVLKGEDKFRPRPGYSQDRRDYEQG